VAEEMICKQVAHWQTIKRDGFDFSVPVCAHDAKAIRQHDLRSQGENKRALSCDQSGRDAAGRKGVNSYK
jgi:hypothetical protein